MMLYKSIVLEMLQGHPNLHEQLRASRTLLQVLDQHAIELKSLHEAWKGLLLQQSPGSDPSQIAAEALELAIQELRESLPSESKGNEAEPLSLDAAMAFVRRPTPAA
jgi:cell division protein FtsL